MNSPSRRVQPLQTVTPNAMPSHKSRNNGTFLDDSTPIDRTQEGAPEDGADLHDLSYSSSMRAPRASMVESMAFALDQYSNSASTPSPYVPRSNSYETPSSHRARGHTFSSSISSDGDTRQKRSTPPFPLPGPRVTRKDSSKYHKNIQKLPSIFGEDEDSVRVKVYDAQRAEYPLKPKGTKTARSRGKSSASSTSSSIDLGHLAAFQGRLGPAGNRRSRSFDFGSTQRPKAAFKHSNPIDVAPTPISFSGLDTRSSPTKESSPAPQMADKNSSKSSKATQARKPRAGTLGTPASKSKPNDPAPPMPKPSTLTAAPSEQKAAATSPLDTSFGSRPNFFRRVFGSSRNVPTYHESLGYLSTPSARPSQDRPSMSAADLTQPSTTPSKLQKPARSSAEFVANKENQPALNKKPSSFFRRRKKSTSNNIPPPLPLTLASERKLGLAPPGEPSPVSSLRAFMDPYLANTNGPHSGGHIRNDSKQSFHTAGLGPTSAPSPKDDPNRRPRHGRTSSNNSARTPRPKPVSSLRIPHHDSFLADSSSTEEPSKGSREPSPDPQLSSRTDLRTAEAASLSTSALAPLNRPCIPDRTQSWSVDTGSKSIPQAVLTPYQAQAAANAGKHPSSSTSSALDIGRRASPRASASDVSVYKSAPSTPLVAEMPKAEPRPSPTVHISHPSISQKGINGDELKAQKIYDNADEELDQTLAAAWLGEGGADRERIRTAFMALFDFTHVNILASLRKLCDRIVLKGETQQVDRLIDAFARRWCACNSNHGLKSIDVVHTICYSILLLNTDLHLADIGQKMTKSQFVRNALFPIRSMTEDQVFEAPTRTPIPRSPTFGKDDGIINESTDNELVASFRQSRRPTDRLTREDSNDVEISAGTGGPLIDAPWTGNDKGWEAQVGAILRSFYSSISQEPLPLFGSQPETCIPQNNFLSLGNSMLRRTPSTLSKAQSDRRIGTDNRSLGARWMSKARSRPRLPSSAGFGSSRTSLDDHSSAWSPSISSTWSKNSIGKTLTSMSVDSFGTEATHGDYQSSIGFANALSQAIIREDQFEPPLEDGMKAPPLLEDESLELCGAPWAKEGILKHKCHLEGVDKRSKDRNWNDCFAVIERGWMRLFSFSMTAKSLRTKAKNQRAAGVVGGGNWQDNAEEVWKFMLRHAIASALPPPGYSKTRPFVFALSLPTGAVHLFSVGTPDIVKEFVSTANFWSARLSKEPMMGGISNMEYGWSDSVVNKALINSESSRSLGGATSPRPSTQMSMRNSIDQVSGTMKPKLPGDRAHINEWAPPQQSMFASQLLEVDQLRALQTYVKNVEEELQRHNELRGPMLLAFSSKHPNSAKAMGNWEKKSSYLLREIVKFRTYIDTLQTAHATKDRIQKMRKEEDDAMRAEDDGRVLSAG